MSNTSFDPGRAARRLAAASRSGVPLQALPEEERPGSLEQGYAVQAAFVDSLGEGAAGWKLAGASPRGLRGELPNPPAIGVLVPSRVVPSGSTVTLPPGRAATLEVEAAFCFSRAVSPAEEAFDAATMIDYAVVAVEVVCSRFADRKAVGQPSFIGDNVGFHALVRGDRLDGVDFGDDAGIWKDGERIAQSMGGEDRTKPWLSLAHLWETFGRQGIAIAKGAIVTTGTLSVPVDAGEAGRYEARLGNAGLFFTLAV